MPPETYRLFIHLIERSLGLALQVFPEKSTPSPVGASPFNSASCFRMYSGHWRWVCFQSFSFNGGSPGTSLGKYVSAIPWGLSSTASEPWGQICPNANRSVYWRAFQHTVGWKTIRRCKAIGESRHSVLHSCRRDKNYKQSAAVAPVHQAWPAPSGAYPSSGDLVSVTEARL